MTHREDHHSKASREKNEISGILSDEIFRIFSMKQMTSMTNRPENRSPHIEDGDPPVDELKLGMAPKSLTLTTEIMNFMDFLHIDKYGGV